MPNLSGTFILVASFCGAAAHRRFHFHFMPTSASWLDMVERFLVEITQKRIRRGAFKSVAAPFGVPGEQESRSRALHLDQVRGQILERGARGNKR